MQFSLVWSAYGIMYYCGIEILMCTNKMTACHSINKLLSYYRWYKKYVLLSIGKLLLYHLGILYSGPRERVLKSGVYPGYPLLLNCTTHTYTREPETLAFPS